MKALRILSLIFQGLFIALIFSAISYIVGFKLGVFPKVNPYIVLSGSMSPAIETGSVVASVPQPAYGVGDIITFSTGGKESTTHRIIGLVNEAGTLKYQTKGDANKTVDPGLIDPGKVVGKAIITLPYVGYAANFAKTPKGFILLVIIPATIIVYEELRTILNEIRRLFLGYKPQATSYKPAKLNLADIFEPIGGSPVQAKILASPSPINRWLIAVPALAALTVAIGLTGSYFLDREVSSENILGAAADFDTPTPMPTPGVAQTLVINELLPNATCKQGQEAAVWLEIYNGYSTSVNLKDFSLTDGTTTIDLVNANNIIVAPQGLVLLAHSTSIFGTNKCWPDNGTQIANLGGQLNLNAPTLQLKDPQNNVIDTVKTSEFTLDPDQSIERIPKGWDTALGINFNVADFTAGTPTPGL